MTKRFEYIQGDGFSDDGEYITPYEMVESANELHKENLRLKLRLADKDYLLNKQLSVNSNLTKIIDNYESSLNNAIDNERTQLGQSVLKQLMEAIQ